MRRVTLEKIVNSWAKFIPYNEILKMWKNEDLTSNELIELTAYNCNLFIKLLLDFPYELSENQKFILDTFFNPKNNYNELLLICGRKAGKTDLTSVIALFKIYQLLQIPNLHQYFNLVKGKPIYAVCIGTNKEEAEKVMFGTIESLVESSPYLSKYVKNKIRGGIQFPFNIRLFCQASSARSVRGFGNIINIYDEICHYIDSRGNLSADEIYEANDPNLAPLTPLSISVGLSSPAGRQGKGWELFKTGDPVRVIQKAPEHGQQKWRAVFQYSTWELNSADWAQLESKYMQTKLQHNPDRFWMEYGAKFCNVVEAALPPEKINRCAIGKPIVMSPTHIDKKTPRVITLDPALTGDSYGLVMGHMEKEGDEDIVVVDLVRYWEARSKNEPISPAIPEALIRKLHERFRITHVVADQYESYSTCERLGKEGIPMHRVHVTPTYNTPAYEGLTRRIITETIEYPPYARLLNELTFLQRKTTSTRTRWEAAVGYTDDLCDCLARLVFTLESERSRSYHFGWED